ncbi:hypothetical protein WKK05_23115 [Nostoc sp. UHCC 0302]|uniref:hypothetical protein n=1 Tax=Nostoc sp. UHCC 0302 TaxID=3134896 RepID=UPI00311CAC59
MPSISLDGFSPLKRHENFYLWLALSLANKSPLGSKGAALLYERLRPKRSYAAGFTTTLSDRGAGEQGSKLTIILPCPSHPPLSLLPPLPLLLQHGITKHPLPFWQRLSSWDKFFASSKLGVAITDNSRLRFEIFW